MRQMAMDRVVVPLLVGLLAGCGDGGGDTVTSAEIPAVMETFGFDLAPFDADTGMAGAMRITGVVPPSLPATDPNKAALDARHEFLFLPFGYGEGDGSTDPQWTVFLPLGTPVVSLVTGTVCDVPLLYSNDYSIRVVPEGTRCEEPGAAALMFETEHVIEPLVAFGDAVTAGQRIATVSDYDPLWREAGFGIIEVGVFFTPDGGTPWHACPSRFFAPGAADAMTATLRSVMEAWSAEIGRPDLYAAANDPALGCFTADVNEGRPASSGG